MSNRMGDAIATAAYGTRIVRVTDYIHDHLDKSMPPPVAAAFRAFPAPARERLERVKALILEVAREDPGIGPLTETLKWGEPAYLTTATGSSSTIRLGLSKICPAIDFNCRTTIISTFRELFRDVFEYSGNRAILLAIVQPIDEAALRLCIRTALTYHSAKRRS